MNSKLGWINSRRDSMILGFLCCLAYAASYLGRINYSAAMTEILESGILDRTQCGALATVYFAVYAIGQIINGLLADRYAPGKMVLIGMLGAGVSNVLMSFQMPYVLRVLLWGGNGFFQAMLWGPMLIVVSRCILPERRNGILLGLNAAPSFGTIAAYLLSGGLLWLFSWEGVFVGSGIVLLIIGGIWGIVYSRIFGRQPWSTKPTQTDELYAQQKQAATSPTTINSIVLLVMSGAAFLALSSTIHGVLKDGITTWLPTYLMENYAVEAQIAVVLTVVTPIINVFGAIAGCKVAGISKSEAHSTALFFSVAAIALGVLILLPELPILICALLFSVITAAMYGANVILVSEVPLRFEQYGKAATISGIMNAAAYLGCASSTYVIGDLSARVGWQATKITWLGVCVAAMASAMIAIKPWKKFRGNMIIR